MSLRMSPTLLAALVDGATLLDAAANDAVLLLEGLLDDGAGGAAAATVLAALRRQLAILACGLGVCLCGAALAMEVIACVRGEARLCVVLWKCGGWRRRQSGGVWARACEP